MKLALSHLLESSNLRYIQVGVHLEPHNIRYIVTEGRSSHVWRASVGLGFGGTWLIHVLKFLFNFIFRVWKHNNKYRTFYVLLNRWKTGRLGWRDLGLWGVDLLGNTRPWHKGAAVWLCRVSDQTMHGLCHPKAACMQNMLFIFVHAGWNLMILEYCKACT